MWFKFTADSSSSEDLSDTKSKDVKKQRNDVVAIVEDPKCLRCQKSRRFYVCVNCIKLGNFSMSKQDKSCNYETYNEKKKAMESLKEEIKECSDFYELRRQDAVAYENLKYDVNEKQRRLEILHMLIAEKRANIQQLHGERRKLQTENVEKCVKVSEAFIKAYNADKELISRQQKNESLREKHNKVHDNLKKSTGSKIEQLISYIFPISLNSSQRENSQVESSAPDDEWLFYANGIDEVQYCIVAPTLPANGDYAAYLDQLEDKQDDSNELQPSQNAGYRILGALTYTTQLVKLMYHCLGVRMPQKLAYGAFCKELSKDTIFKKIVKLNMSIMYLAYTQNVKLHSMNESHTLENILIILDRKRSDLGRFGFHAVGNAPLVKSVDSLLLDIDEISDDISSEEDSETDISFCLDLEEQSEILEATNVQADEAESNLAQNFISAAASQITSIFGWMK